MMKESIGSRDRNNTGVLAASDETYQALIELCELANEYSEESFNREEGIRS